MALIPRLSKLHQKLNKVHTRFGDPRYHPVQIINSGTTIDLGNLSVLPVNPDRIGAYLGDTVQIMGDEWIVSDISRTFPLESLQRGLWRIDGKDADLMYLDQRSPITFDAVVRYRDRGK